jgi:hypothetical protein
MAINPEIRLPSNLTYLRTNQNLIIVNKKHFLSLLLTKLGNNETLTTNMCVEFHVLTAVAVKISGM